jgi:hypothetical protein
MNLHRYFLQRVTLVAVDFFNHIYALQFISIVNASCQYINCYWVHRIQFCLRRQQAFKY